MLTPGREFWRTAVFGAGLAQRRPIPWAAGTRAHCRAPGGGHQGRLPAAAPAGTGPGWAAGRGLFYVSPRKWTSATGWPRRAGSYGGFPKPWSRTMRGKSTRQDARAHVQSSSIAASAVFPQVLAGRARRTRFKRYLRLAYWPRLAVAALGAPFSASLAAQARTYRRLLAELPGM